MNENQINQEVFAPAVWQELEMNLLSWIASCQKWIITFVFSILHTIYLRIEAALSLAKTQMWTKSSPIWYNICVIRYLYGFVWSSCFIFTNRETSDLKMAFVYLCQWFWSIPFVVICYWHKKLIKTRKWCNESGLNGLNKYEQ